MRLLKKQQSIADENFDALIFLEGAAGTGKTTAAIERVKSLVREGVAPDSILVLAPQLSLATPYRDALRRSRVDAAGDIRTATLASLAVESVDLFWPLIAEEVGFANPTDRPHFLSLELVQYYMTRFVEPEIRQRDYFNSVRINQNRLYTQIVDNLNKAAVVGFPHDQIGARLKSAWAGEAEQAFIYDDAQASATLFREKCRQHNLLDFSLQISLFLEFLWTKPQPRRYLTDHYRHLIVDNIEEDSPATHDLLLDWLKECDSAVLIYDTDGGYRRFLGADSVNAYMLKDRCDVHVALDNSRVMSPELEAFQVEFAQSLNQPHNGKPKADAREAIAYTDNQYLPQMIDWTVDNIAIAHQGSGRVTEGNCHPVRLPAGRAAFLAANPPRRTRYPQPFPPSLPRLARRTRRPHADRSGEIGASLPGRIPPINLMSPSP